MEKLLEAMFTSALVISAITYLSKKLIEHFFKTREKQYESSLKIKLDKEILTYKSEIERASHKFNVRVSGVYERQASVISEIYSQLSDLEYYMDVAINQGTPWDEKYDKFKSAYFSFRDYWRKHRILLPKDADIQIEALLKDAFWSVENYGSGELQFLSRDFDGGSAQKTLALELKKSIPDIMEKLRNSFRSYIGVSD